MSILIKGMDKPKHCSECYFVCHDQCELQEGSYNHGTFKEQREHCPLIEIPKEEEGRLVIEAEE